MPFGFGNLFGGQGGAQSLSDIFRSSFGGQFGFGRVEKRRLFEDALADIAPQFQAGQRAGIANLQQRGFGTATPISNFAGLSQAGFTQAQGDIGRGIAIESGRAGQRQRELLFGAQANLFTQEQLLRLQKELGEKGFGDFLGQLLGFGVQGAGFALGGGFKRG